MHLSKLFRRSFTSPGRFAAQLVIAGFIGGAAVTGTTPVIGQIQPAYACSAGPIASKAAKSFISAAQARSSSAFANALRRHVNMRRISRFALGRHRRDVEPGDFPGYQKAMTKYVAKTLVGFSKNFDSRGFVVRSCQGSTVRGALIRNSGKSVPVLMKVRNGKVEDVNLQNVWMAQILRSTVGSIIRRDGLSGFFRTIGLRSRQDFIK